MINLGFIYKITNKINGKVYIGKTKYSDATKRWKEHLYESSKKRGSEKRPLYNAINCYGLKNFEFEVIEEVADESLSEKEIYYIKLYKSFVGFKDSNGYNATLGGDGISYLNLDENQVIEYHISHGNKLGETAHKFNVDNGTISKILTKHDIHWLNNQELSSKKSFESTGGVAQIDENTHEILNIFDTITDANLYLGKPKENGNIGDALNRRKSHKAYGYLWYFVKDLDCSSVN